MENESLREQGFKLYDEAERIWLNSQCTSNRFGPGIDYNSLKASLIENYYMPAASYGCPMAMLKCAEFYKSRKPLLAATYYKNWLKSMKH